MARDRRLLTFGLLILAQMVHSVEEYVGRLYIVFPPAQFVSGLIATDVRRGFIIANVTIAVLGVGSWLLARSGRATGVMWIWIAVEMINGIGHPAWSIVHGGYTPGVATAPVLLILAVILALQLSTSAS